MYLLVGNKLVVIRCSKSKKTLSGTAELTCILKGYNAFFNELVFYLASEFQSAGADIK